MMDCERCRPYSLWNHAWYQFPILSGYWTLGIVLKACHTRDTLDLHNNTDIDIYPQLTDLGYRRRHGGWEARWLFPASEWQGQILGPLYPQSTYCVYCIHGFYREHRDSLQATHGFIMGQGGAHFQSQKLVFSFIYWDATSEGPICKPCTLGLSSNESTALTWSPWLRGLRNQFGSRDGKDLHPSIHPPVNSMASPWRAVGRTKESNTAVTNWQKTCFCTVGLFSPGYKVF